MKRSEIDKIIGDAIDFMASHQLYLPPFAYWSPQDAAKLGAEYAEVVDNMLGWDITDFGLGNYDKVGLLMFTARNGFFRDIEGTKPYAEKYMIVKEGQVTPYHFHWKKTEDIINRGGGNLIVKMYESTPDEKLSARDVQIHSDGRCYTAPAGTEIRLTPGQSVCLHRGQYHAFWGEEGKGTVLVGEVSCTNDDNVDNRFLEPTGRFPVVEEDVPAKYMLFSEIRLANVLRS